MSRRRVLIVGATGAFGRRLARHLADEPGFELVLASRRRERALALSRELEAAGAAAALNAVAFDRAHAPGVPLARLAPWAVVDCSGPFQDADLALATGALGAGAHFVDLADAPAYLRRHAKVLDPWARALGVTAIAGASSTPGLSGAAVAALVQGWQRVDAIEIAILPGRRGHVGRAALAAAADWAGRPVPVWRDGRLTTTPGWLDARPVTLPGLCRRRRAAVVESADAAILGPRHAVTGSVTLRAGLESALERGALRALAWLRRAGLVRDAAPLVPAMAAVRALSIRFGSDRGGMQVYCRGVDGAGRTQEARWHLVADRGDGPCVPVLPAAAALRALQAGTVAPGAHLACDVLALPDVEREMAGYAIACGSDVGRAPSRAGDGRRVAGPRPAMRAGERVGTHT